MLVQQFTQTTENGKQILFCINGIGTYPRYDTYSAEYWFMSNTEVFWVNAEDLFSKGIHSNRNFFPNVPVDIDHKLGAFRAFDNILSEIDKGYVRVDDAYLEMTKFYHANLLSYCFTAFSVLFEK